jgi:hypothetical protein
LTKVKWDACVRATDGALRRIEETWGTYKTLVERVLAANQVPPEVNRAMLRHYIDTVQAWVENQRQQTAQRVSCIERRGFGYRALMNCLAEGANLAAEGVRLSQEIDRLSKIMRSLESE